MRGQLLAKGIRGRLAESFISLQTLPAAGFATKEVASGILDKEKESKLQTLLKLLAPAPEVEVTFSEADLEEWAKRAKEFSSQSMKAHREHQRDLMTRLHLKRAAIAALPPLLQMGATVPFTDPAPLDRMMFTDTPPQKQTRKELPGRGAVRLGTKQRT